MFAINKIWNACHILCQTERLFMVRFCMGSIIHTGEPICSIIAGGKNEQQVEDLLLSRQQQLMNLLR